MPRKSLKRYCGAKTKRGGICRETSMPNGRCYVHGGATPAKHPNFRGHKNALKHGMYSKDSELIKIIADFSQMTDLIKHCQTS
jgi:hypothetical protein